MPGVCCHDTCLVDVGRGVLGWRGYLGNYVPTGGGYKFCVCLLYIDIYPKHTLGYSGALYHNRLVFGVLHYTSFCFFLHVSFIHLLCAIPYSASRFTCELFCFVIHVFSTFCFLLICRGHLGTFNVWFDFTHHSSWGHSMCGLTSHISLQPLPSPPPPPTPPTTSTTSNILQIKEVEDCICLLHMTMTKSHCINHSVLQYRGLTLCL